MEEYHRSNYSVFSLDRDNSVLVFSWKATTLEMNDEEFQIENLDYANLAETLRVTGLLVDVREFNHKFEMDLMSWRQNHVIPKYNRAGVRKMAFLHSESFDTSSTDETQEGDYTVARFNYMEEAMEWLRKR